MWHTLEVYQALVSDESVVAPRELALVEETSVAAQRTSDTSVSASPSALRSTLISTVTPSADPSVRSSGGTQLSGGDKSPVEATVLSNTSGELMDKKSTESVGAVVELNSNQEVASQSGGDGVSAVRVVFSSLSLPRLNKFTGDKPDDDDGADQLLTQCERHDKLAGRESEQLKLKFEVHLSGRALNVYEALALQDRQQYEMAKNAWKV